MAKRGTFTAAVKARVEICLKAAYAEFRRRV